MPSDSKVVLITGASSGLGLATTLYLAAKGCTVIGTSRSRERLVDIEQQAAAKNLAITTVVLDVNSDEGVAAVVPGLLEKFGRIDVLVNNAGYGLWGPLQTLTSDEVRAQFETNLLGPFRMANAVLPAMVERRSGTIINVSSVAGRVPTPFNGAYSASKAALEGMSESLYMEMRPFGVRVAIIEPGVFKSEFHANQKKSDKGSESGSRYKDTITAYHRKHDRILGFSHDPVGVA
ncbi:MAG: SDR family oxidoreductase, partial [SAR202 cluster bacterium]|nr:SDR family oxidoreductase [SAR202 cluster bacterium]